MVRKTQLQNKDSEMNKKSEPIIVSACLIGMRCRYDGRSKPNSKIIDLVKEENVVLVCPEQLGGLPTPRTGCQRVGNKVMRRDGVEVTDEYQRGAEEVLRIAKLLGCKKAVLKAKSPSCGSGLIQDGSFSGKYIKGDGICAELLKKNGIEVLTEDEI